jgi:hypothetical protein
MANYRLVWRDAQGKALKSTHLERATDRAAIEAAEQLIGDCAMVEIWEGFRPVGRVGKPDGAPTS